MSATELRAYVHEADEFVREGQALATTGKNNLTEASATLNSQMQEFQGIAFSTKEKFTEAADAYADISDKETVQQAAAQSRAAADKIDDAVATFHRGYDDMIAAMNTINEVLDDANRYGNAAIESAAQYIAGLQ